MQSSSFVAKAGLVEIQARSCVIICTPLRSQFIFRETAPSARIDAIFQAILLSWWFAFPGDSRLLAIPAWRFPTCPGGPWFGRTSTSTQKVGSWLLLVPPRRLVLFGQTQRHVASNHVSNQCTGNIREKDSICSSTARCALLGGYVQHLLTLTGTIGGRSDCGEGSVQPTN